MRITALNWRSMVGRKPDAHIMVVPNARLSDAALEVLPQDELALLVRSVWRHMRRLGRYDLVTLAATCTSSGSIVGPRARNWTPRAPAGHDGTSPHP